MGERDFSLAKDGFCGVIGNPQVDLFMTEFA
jgi:hypothetical protein